MISADCSVVQPVDLPRLGTLETRLGLSTRRYTRGYDSVTTDRLPKFPGSPNSKCYNLLRELLARHTFCVAWCPEVTMTKEW